MALIEIIRKAQQLHRRHGMLALLRFSVVNRLRRLANIELCVVTTSHNLPTYHCPAHYSMDVLTPEQLRLAFTGTSNTCSSPAAAAALTDFREANRQAFARGDHCVVTRHQDTVVGYNFYATGVTPVREGVVFSFGNDYFYSYNAHTDVAHRGKGLAPARWTYFRKWRESNGFDMPTISYIALDNLASLASGKKEDGQTLGFTACWEFRGRSHCASSAGCRRHKVGFQQA